LSIDTAIDQNAIDLIKRKGYSRIPIYYGENKNFIIGVLIVKSLIGFNMDIKNPKSLRELSSEEMCIIKTPIYASPNATVGSMLDIFKKGSGHLAIVVENP
jgi:putative hemolysin